MTFSEKLQRLRKENGWSQEELAERIHVSRQALSKWELGTAVPDTANVLQLSRLFGVSTDYLLNDDYDSDRDVPAAKAGYEAAAQAFRKKCLNILGILFTASGVVGDLVIWVLSSMTQVHVTKSYTASDGKVCYYGGGDVLGYSYTGFIREYRLQALLIVFTVLLLAGAFLLWRVHEQKKTESQEATNENI